MAYKMPLFTALDIKQEKPLLRQTFYWVLANQEKNSVCNLQKCLLIFSNEQRARDFAELFRLDFEPKALFWDEIVCYFNGVYDQAIVNNTGQEEEELIQLDLCEDAEDEEEEKVALYY